VAFLNTSKAFGNTGRALDSVELCVELCAEPLYIELRIELRAELCAEPLYIELCIELRAELYTELYTEL